MRKFLLLFLPFLIAGLFFVLDKTKEQRSVPFDVEQALKERASKEYLDRAIQQELARNQLEEAQALVDIANYLNVDINRSLLQTLQNKQEGIEGLIHSGEDFFKGFFSGKVQNSASLAGSISSDFTLIGDIRDIYKEGNHYLNNEPYNKFILSLSLLGVGLSLTTFSSFGLSTPLKVANSTLKSAKKSRYLTPKFSELLSHKLEQSVDIKMLKKIDMSSLEGIKQSKKIIAQSIHIKPLKAILEHVAALKKNSSTIDTIKILRFIDNQKELQRAVALSKKYKKNSYGVFKVLGKKALKTTKVVLKKGSLYFITLLSLIFSALFWLSSLLFTLYLFFRK